LIAVAIVVAIVVWLFHWLYLRSSKERAFVRTGMGGQKVVMNGGAFVLPIVHDVIPVNMNTLPPRSLARPRQGPDHARPHACRRHRRVLRARPGDARRHLQRRADPRASARCSRTLLKELLEGKFVDALRTVAAEAHHGGTCTRSAGNTSAGSATTVAADLLQNGLELESASLTQLDQTAMEYFNPVERVRRRGLDPPHRADRAPQEAPQRHRAGHA
jgi:uncharacterized membrane protein YqiK